MSDYKVVSAEMIDLIKRLRIKAGMIELGEIIAWGSDSALMREAADVLERAGSATTVQGEPVGWQYYQHGKWWSGDNLTKDQRKNIEKEGIRVRNVYAAPQPLPCQECGGDGAGGEHEEDCAMAQPAEQQPASRPWSYCPECGSEHVQHHEGEYKQCADCYQEWFSDIDYTNVVRKHLAGKFRDKDAEIKRLRSAKSAKPAPDVAGLIVLLEQAQCPNCDESGTWHNDYGEPERCQWCHERSEALDAHRNGGGV